MNMYTVLYICELLAELVKPAAVTDQAALMKIRGVTMSTTVLTETTRKNAGNIQVGNL